MEWRYTSGWPTVMGWIDLRGLAPWLLCIFRPEAAYLAAPTTLLFAICSFYRMTPTDLARFIRARLAGGLRGATPVWRIRSTLGGALAPVLLVVLLAGGVTQSAEASFRIIDRQAAGADKTGFDLAAYNPIIEGFGKGIPLSTMMGEILPPEWKVYYESPQIADRAVDWEGRRPLMDVLDGLSSRYALAIDANLDDKRLFIGTPKPCASDAQDCVAKGSFAMSGEIASMLRTTPVGRTWRLQDGETLSQGLSRWLSVDGWKIAWELPVDYPIRYDAEFRGTLKEAIAGVKQSYDEQGEMRDVEFVFKDGNRVLVVRRVSRAIPLKSLIK
jgi:hypothetical protein